MSYYIYNFQKKPVLILLRVNSYDNYIIMRIVKVINSDYNPFNFKIDDYLAVYPDKNDIRPLNKLEKLKYL